MPSYQIDNDLFSGFVNTETEPELIADGCIWTEGPVWFKDRLYFSDIPNKRLMSWHPAEGLETALSNSEFCNGNTVSIDGRMMSCEHGGRRVIVRNQLDKLDAAEVIAERFEGKRLNSPNDVVVKSDGSIWFTDPSYGIDSNIEGYAAVSEIGNNNVYRVSAEGEMSIVASDFDKPNGLAFSQDESLLYITDTGAARGPDFPELDMSRPHHVRVFDVDGASLKNGRVFAVVEPGVPDGLRVDTEGYVWCSAADGLHCLSPEAELLGKVLLPMPVSNCCFGGNTGSDLFITCSDKVYRVKTTRQGASNLS